MSDIQTASERDVTLKPITETYKGILRVGNNNDSYENIPDDFLNPIYFTSSTDTAWVGDGFNITRSFLDEESPNERYSTKDSYSNLKLPVTDSMGNFLNFALGQSSSEVGKIAEGGAIIDCTKQFDDSDTTTFAVVDTSNYIVMGLSERVLENNKKLSGSSLYIDSSSKDVAKLVINNYYHHGSNDEANTFTPISDSGFEQVRTIFTYNGVANQYDAFIYNQENYKLSEDKTKKDCYITIENIKNYVSDRLAGHLKVRNSELPSGTIISQYCDLKKWFCVSTDSGMPDDKGMWQGYRPAMYTTSDTPYAIWNNLQGRACHADTYLYLNGDKNDHLTSELPPDFKRGYVLCNGDGYTIQLNPLYIQSNTLARKSLDLFFDLFYTLGYYYQSTETPLGIRRVRKTTNNYYEFVNSDKIRCAQKYYPSDRNVISGNVLYGIDMAIILAFKEFDKRFNSNVNSLTSVEDAITWLKSLPISNEYVYNVISPDANAETNYYNYTDTSGNTVSINIGKEIRSFKDKIPYYIFEEGTYKLVECEIYNMAEVRHIAKLFVEKATDDYWIDYYFTFNVPKLFTYTDNSVNLGESYRLTGKKMDELPKVTVGMFIGSNGLSLADTIYNASTSTSFDPSKFTYNVETNYNTSLGLTPHSHAIAIGDLEFSQNYKNIWHQPSDIDSGSRIGLTSPNINEDTFIINTDNPAVSYTIAANYHTTQYTYPGGSGNTNLINNSEMKNYILQEVTEAQLTKVYNTASALHGYEYRNGNYFKWYGASSEPLWYDDNVKLNEVTSKYTEGNSVQGYFRPESIKLLPLIKL